MRALYFPGTTHVTNIQGCISKDHSLDVVEEFYWSKNFLFTILLLLRSSSIERCVTVADPGFSPGGGANSQNCYYFSHFCRKLHKNERIWTPRGGRASLAPPPWIRQCVSLPTSTGFGSYENLFPDVSKKRKCCDMGQNDTVSKIELNPSFVLSSDETNCKNDIQ